MGLGRILVLHWMERVAGGGIEADDPTVCYIVLCTSVKRRQLSGASFWVRMLGNYRLSFDWTATGSARVYVAMFS